MLRMQMLVVTVANLLLYCCRRALARKAFSYTSLSCGPRSWAQRKPMRQTTVTAAVMAAQRQSTGLARGLSSSSAAQRSCRRRVLRPERRRCASWRPTRSLPARH